MCAHLGAVRSARRLSGLLQRELLARVLHRGQTLFLLVENTLEFAERPLRDVLGAAVLLSPGRGNSLPPYEERVRTCADGRSLGAMVGDRDYLPR